MKQSGPKFKRVVQLELNEIAPRNIQKLIAAGKLPHFARIQQQWRFLETSSETDYAAIEPWIQWVTAHTGRSLAEHQIFRLGDAHALRHEQIWESLSRRGVPCAVIGAMNARRGHMPDGVFFPDPWSKTNDAFPAELQGLWALISRRVQGHAASEPSAADLQQALKACWRFKVSPLVMARIGRQLLVQRRDPQQKWRLAGLFDLLLAEIFLTLLQEPSFGFCSLFLNSVAHYQHHFWRRFDESQFAAGIRCPDCRPEDDPIAFGYEIMDEILGKVLTRVNLKETLVVIASGLSQVPDTRHEALGGMNYYRLKDHRRFAQLVGIEPEQVFPLMSRDWQVRVTDPTSAARLLGVLNAITVNGEALFSCSRSSEGYLFVETALTRSIADTAQLQLGSRPLGSFGEHLLKIAIKSGHHTGTGALWLSDSAQLPAAVGASMPLAKIFDLAFNALA